MHFQYFGLDRNPFEITPDPQFLYLGEKHREALSHLMYSVLAKKPFILLTGDIGVGKTTILHYFISQLKKKENIYLVSLLNPKLDISEFYYLLALELGLEDDIKDPFIKSQFLVKFKNFLLSLFQQDKSLVIIIDEAQSAPVALLEEIRLLANLTQEKQGLVIILVGQPELIKKLSSEELYSLRQRLSFRYHLGPFDSKEEVSAYLITRILRAGSPKTRIFTDDAIDAIYKYSKGVPRLINIIADHAMLTAYLKGEAIVGASTIEECLPEIEHLLKDVQKHLELANPPSISNFSNFDFKKRFKFKNAYFWIILSILLVIIIFFRDKLIDFWRFHWAN